jgi:ubiquinone/menaquinone biosynthesis C-methylase UbiE
MNINKKYIEINRKAYDKLAEKYEKRMLEDDYEIKDDYWYKMLDKIIKRDNDKVLEIGPGSGRNLKIFDCLHCDTTAVELSKSMCEVARKWSPNSKIINANILDCDFESKSFDIIALIAVIHNFPMDDADLLLKKVGLWLKDDGYLIIGTTIHKKENSGLIPKIDYKGNIERYRYQYTKESFENLVKSNGFGIVESYIVTENNRDKTWYDLICKKIS